jgi:hypothetical protein
MRCIILSLAAKIRAGLSLKEAMATEKDIAKGKMSAAYWADKVKWCSLPKLEQKLLGYFRPQIMLPAFQHR